MSEGMRAELEEAATGQGPDAAILEAIRTTVSEQRCQVVRFQRVLRKIEDYDY